MMLKDNCYIQYPSYHGIDGVSILQPLFCQHSLHIGNMLQDYG